MEAIGYILIGVGILIVLIANLWLFSRESQRGSGLFFLFTGLTSGTSWKEQRVPFFYMLAGFGFVILGALILHNS